MSYYSSVAFIKYMSKYIIIWTDTKVGTFSDLKYRRKALLSSIDYLRFQPNAYGEQRVNSRKKKDNLLEKSTEINSIIQKLRQRGLISVNGTS